MTVNNLGAFLIEYTNTCDKLQADEIYVLQVKFKVTVSYIYCINVNYMCKVQDHSQGLS